MMLTANSKDNVTETLSSQKQELDSITKLKLKSAKKKKLLLARKFLKKSTCLEDTSQDSNLPFMVRQMGKAHLAYANAMFTSAAVSRT